MTTLSIIPLGVGDAFSALYYSSCLAIGANDKWLLIDCPHPIRKMLKEASDTSGVRLDVGNFSAIALTHLHADHASGLEGFFYFSRFVLQRQPTLLAHEDVLSRVWPDHLAAGMDCLMDLEHKPKSMTANEYFNGVALHESRSHEIDGFSIECRKTIHHVPTTAFRITVGDKSVAYSADTAFDTTLIDWLSESDLVIHETKGTGKNQRPILGPIHLAWRFALRCSIGYWASPAPFLAPRQTSASNPEFVHLFSPAP